MAPVALAALGILGALLMIFAGLVALNHTVLPFKGWPLDAERLSTGTQVLPRAPVETGRLRTAPGGALAVALRSSAPLARAAAVTALTPSPRVTIRVQRRASHPVSHRPPAKPAPAPVAATPVAAPAPAVATPAPVAAAPVAAPVASSPAPIARRPLIAARQPGSVMTSTSTSIGHGRGNGSGRAHAPGQLKKAVAAAAPVAAAVGAPALPAAPAANGEGNGHGHGPPPWAHGHH